MTPLKAESNERSWFYNIQQEKHVNTVAVGIGGGVKKKILQQIAGEGNPVVQVKDFSRLQKMIETIKASACSGVLLTDL